MILLADENLNNIVSFVGEAVIRLLLLALLVVAMIVLLRFVQQRLVVWLHKRSEIQKRVWLNALVDALAAPVQIIVIALAIVLGASILAVGDSVQRVVNAIFATLVSIAIAIAVIRVIDHITPSHEVLLRTTGISIDDRLIPFIRTSLKIGLGTLLVLTVLGTWGLDITALVTALGVGALGITLAAQDTIANLFGFFTIVSDQPFVIGDYIKTPDVEGIVEKAGWRSIRVRQVDQLYVTVPNKTIANSAIQNFSRRSKRLFEATFTFRHNNPFENVDGLLERIRALLDNTETVEANSITVRISNVTLNGPEILVRCYIMRADMDGFFKEREAIYYAVIGLVKDSGFQLATSNPFQR